MLLQYPTLVLFLATAACTVISHLDPLDLDQGKCEPITIPMCLGIGYNQTRMPNELNHESQEEAALEAHQFWPLVQIKCSPEILFFLCSMYAPICLQAYQKPLPPCRGLCQRARAGCEPIMLRYDFKWPERMDCDLFPVFGASPDVLCMDQNNGSSNPTTVKPTKKTSKSCKGSKNCASAAGSGGGSGSNSIENKKQSQSTSRECKCQCQAPLVPLALNRSVAGVSNCAHPCKESYFKQDEKEFAQIWITLGSALCAASTLMTLVTFSIETQRFKYPERPIVFLSACYFLVSLGYLLRVSVGHEAIACEGPIIRYNVNGLSLCSLVFILVYFFGMASSIWWVVLSFTWFLAAGLKWGNEAISGYSQYFHLFAWFIPTAQTVAVLLSGAVDGDPISGICYVGNMNMENLRAFVLAPLVVYLLLGTSFLLSGFVSLFRIRNVIKKQGGVGVNSKTDKLEKLMIRIGIFSVLYTVPASIVIACYLYENAFHEEWLRSLACNCRHAAPVTFRQKPLYSVIMLKYFMMLAVGITSGVWIWSGKTLDSWRRFWRRCFGRSPDFTGANAVLIKNRSMKAAPPQYLVSVPGSASLLGPPGVGSVTSTSQHHLHHHHVLKQPPLSHV